MFTRHTLRRALNTHLLAAMLCTVLPASMVHAAELSFSLESGTLPAAGIDYEIDQWAVSETRAHAGRYSMVSGPTNGNYQSLYIASSIESGSISFYYYMEGQCCTTLYVVTDIEDYSYNLDTEGWHYISIPIVESVSYVFLDFVDDNFYPDESDPDESDPDKRIWLDDITITGIVGDDNDGDGYFSSGDNCPMISNPDQLDSDSDAKGDLCDDDDDNDGLTDAQEAAYDFLSPTDPLDALIDSDNDGLVNLDEIRFGFDPSKAEDSHSVNLTDFFPLGEIQWSYQFDGAVGTTTSTKGENDNTFVYTGSYTTTDGRSYERRCIFEMRDDGIYLLELDEILQSGDGALQIKTTTTISGGILQFPFATQLNEVVYAQADYVIDRWINGEPKDAPDGTLYREIWTTAAEPFNWNGTNRRVANIEISDGYNVENPDGFPVERWVLGEGMGQLRHLDWFLMIGDDRDLNDLRIRSIYNSTPDGTTTDTDTPARETGNQSGGGGSVDLIIAMLLSIVGMGRKIRR